MLITIKFVFIVSFAIEENFALFVFCGLLVHWLFVWRFCFGQRFPLPT